MNRRKFARTLAGAALSAAALAGGAAAAETGAQTSAKGIPFKLSVMLWTVYRDLPFEQRLEKVAEAGYQAVELVDEYKSWSTEEFRRVSLKVRSLNIVFDTIAQVKSGIADPGALQTFLSDLNTLLPIAEKLECPAIIVLSGNRVEGL